MGYNRAYRVRATMQNKLKTKYLRILYFIIFFNRSEFIFLRKEYINDYQLVLVVSKLNSHLRFGNLDG